MLQFQSGRVKNSRTLDHLRYTCEPVEYARLEHASVFEVVEAVRRAVTSIGLTCSSVGLLRFCLSCKFDLIRIYSQFRADKI